MKIEKEDEKILHLKQHIADGKSGEDEFTIALSIPPNTLLYIFKDATYKVHLKSIAEEVIKFRENTKG